jgi:hypothetical protein
MKNLYILILIAVPALLFAQDPVHVPEGGCDPVGIYTNPDEYINPNDPNEDLLWDWRIEEYTMYIPANGGGTQGVATPIISPFFDQSGNPNTFSLADAIDKDFASENGWELLYKKFGTESQGVTTPYFVLYNRYSGTIRVLVNIINSGTFPYTAGGISLAMELPNGTPGSFTTQRQTSVLNLLGLYTFANDQLQRGANHLAANFYENNGVNDNYYWLYSDFNSLYDPCTCGLVSNMFLNAGLISNIDIELTLNGTLTTIVDANPNNNNPDETAVSGFFGAVQEYATFGSGLITGLQGVATSANEGFRDGQALVTQSQQFALNTTNIVGADNAATFARILGQLFFEAPRVNMLLNTVSTLITFVEKAGKDYNELTNENTKGKDAIAKSKITESNLQADATGQLTVNSNHVLNSLRVPGSQIVSNGGSIDFQHPVYDEILGVWNLFEQPKFDLVAFIPDPYILVDIQDNGTPDPSDPYSPGIDHVQNSGAAEVFPPIYHVKLKNTPKLIINPAANVELIDVKYQVVFDNYDASHVEVALEGMMQPGNFEYWEDTKKLYSHMWRHGFYETTYTDREDYTTAMGYSVFTRQDDWDTSTISTPYLGQSCIENYPIFSYSEIAGPRLRVTATFKPKDSDPDSEVDEIIFVHTFPGVNDTIIYPKKYEIEGTAHLDPTQTGYEPVSVILPIDISGFSFGFSANNILENEVISTSMVVSGDLIVDDNVTFEPGTYTIAATKNIYVNKSLINLPANTYVTFEAGNEIYVNPEAIVEPEIILQINPNNILECELAKEDFPKTADIVAFCNGNVYDGRSTPADKKVDIFNPDWTDSEYGTVQDNNFQFEIYPNPTENHASIVISNVEGDETIEILDMSGRRANFNFFRTIQGMELDLSLLDQGVYHIKVSSLRGSKTKQLIILK